ncbi:hypothetical protein pb186bvf_016421 [Paramecium bursaria]
MQNLIRKKEYKNLQKTKIRLSQLLISEYKANPQLFLKNLLLTKIINLNKIVQNFQSLIYTQKPDQIDQKCKEYEFNLQHRNQEQDRYNQIKEAIQYEPEQKKDVSYNQLQLDNIQAFPEQRQIQKDVQSDSQLQKAQSQNKSKKQQQLKSILLDQIIYNNEKFPQIRNNQSVQQEKIIQTPYPYGETVNVIISRHKVSKQNAINNKQYRVDKKIIFNQNIIQYFHAQIVIIYYKSEVNPRQMETHILWEF